MNRKFLSIFLIFLFLFSNLSFVLADDDNSYSINHANIILDIKENGILHVKESLSYSFIGEFNGAYREISLKNGESVQNLNISTEGAYSRHEVVNEDGYYKIKIYLFEDEAMTQKIANKDVIVNIEYDYINSLKIYNDVGELHYKIWGEEWDVGVGEIHSEINFKSKDGVKYWINPYDNYASGNWSGNTLIIDSGYVSPGNYLEVRSTIPLSQFQNPIYANQINKDGLAEIEKVQEDYKNAYEFEETIFDIIPKILLLSLLLPIYLYYKYGKEPKIDYNGIYEREPPNNYSPIFVNAMFDGTIGSLNKKGFQSGVMDLINKKYLQLIHNDEKSIKLKINNLVDLSKLKEYESGIINILRDFEVDGIIDLDQMYNMLKNESNAKRFDEKYKLWVSDYEAMHVDNIIYKYFIDDGYTYLKVYSVILAIASIILIFFSMDSLTYSAGDAYFTGIFTIIVAIILFILPNKIFGKWTKSGMEENKKWENFKKYLNDFSLMKEYPPSSIAIWNDYLVYATALGVAKNVKKAMDFHLPDGSLENDDLYYYQSNNGSILLYSAMRTGFSTANPSSSGGVGGVGGGSGGGGGGAF
ncbi:DUF2207 domain-containing protein [Methanobrevibacter sp. DSM 116169]|uniref:DUF2207 domain-containing protein n=1 Tax=Methanobrevibacter sp. DSM 116169 TaxID=3242727 RepID=UPI0038FC89CC